MNKIEQKFSEAAKSFTKNVKNQPKPDWKKSCKMMCEAAKKASYSFEELSKSLNSLK